MRAERNPEAEALLLTRLKFKAERVRKLNPQRKLQLRRVI
jgi:hypothetical protein